MQPLPIATVTPVVGGLAASDEERQARTAKRNKARRRFELRNARLRREEEQRQAERLARTQRNAQQAQAQALDPVQAALERVRAQKAATADAALKKAKVDLAMSRAQLHKSLKAFGHPPTFEQQSQLIALQRQFETAEQALARLESAASPATPAPKPAVSDDAELKRAKIQLAMRRAELSKARAAATPEQLQALEQAVKDAEQRVNVRAAR
jgi:electron transport complex protein RnfB